MFRNYIKTTLRNLWKNRTFSFLNIFGLSIGIACAGLIFLWVEDEMKFDRFNQKKDLLYVARVNASLDAGVFTHWSTPGVMAPAMQAEIPGIANTCRTSEGETALLFSTGEKPVYCSGKYAEPSLFSMFTLPFVEGNAKSAFAQLYSVVITEKMAKKLFGNEKNLVGKTVRVDNKQNYVISGVLKNIPQNSSLQFEWVAPFQIWYQQSPWAYIWSNNCLTTYVELKPGIQPENINKQLYNFVQKRAPESMGHVFLQSMNNWHLYGQYENGKPTGGGQITYVRLFSIIAWIILIIACINFMNLSTARSEKRAREVGVRKVLGAGKKGLVIQFIGEAIFMSVLASIAALILISLSLPLFNILVQKTLFLNLGNLLHLSVLLGITFICGLTAGIYPSLYLSSFHPAHVLKGIKLKTGSAAIIRKGLVVLQFTISIILIICTIVIYQQMQHVKDRNLGFNKDNLIEFELQGNMAAHFAALKQDLLNTGAINRVALADHSVLYGGNNTDNFSWQGKAPGRILISWRSVDTEFFPATGMTILEGRNFELSDTVNYDNSSFRPNAIITRSMADLMGKGTAIGKTFYDANDTMLHATVVGVVADHVYGDMYGQPSPIVFFSTSPRFQTLMYVSIKPNRSIGETMTKIEAVMKKDNPAYPMQFRFISDQFNESFLNEMLISKLSRIFAALAIIISCLGLFGLASYTAERRTKEIGIRKVLGASVQGIARLLSYDFIKLVLLSTLIAFPIAWYTMHNWLQGYAYRIEIQGWIFLAAGVTAILIALITISFQAIRAAIANPVNSLRSE